MTVPDLEKRIEAAYAVIEHDSEACHYVGENDVGDMLRAAFPELFTDPPTAWLAPWESTREMDAVYRLDRDPWPDYRDAYLKHTEGR